MTSKSFSEMQSNWNRTGIQLAVYRQELFDVMGAYGDCWIEDASNKYSTRKLDFRCEYGVPVDIAITILSMAGVEQYNDFNFECLAKFDDNCTIQIAREGSVCLYVTRKGSYVEMPTAQDVKADEMDEVSGEDNVFRYWWD